MSVYFCSSVMGQGFWSKFEKLPIPPPVKIALLSMVGTLQGYWFPNLLYYISSSDITF